MPKKTSTAPAAIAATWTASVGLSTTSTPSTSAPTPRRARLHLDFGVVPQLPPQAGERRLHVLGIERRGRRADHQAAEREQEPAGDQRPDEGVEQPGARGLDVRVGELVLALETGHDPRAQDQEHHRQQSADDSHRDAAAQHRDPPVRSHHDRGRERQQRKQRQHDAEHAHIVRDRQRLAGEVAPAQRHQIGLEVLGQLLGQLRGHRAQCEAHQLGGV